MGSPSRQPVGRRNAPHIQHIGKGQQPLRVQPPGISHQRQHIGVLARGAAYAHPLIHQAHRQLPNGGLLGILSDDNDHIYLRAAMPPYIPVYCTAIRTDLQAGGKKNAAADETYGVDRVVYTEAEKLHSFYEK